MKYLLYLTLFLLITSLTAATLYPEIDETITTDTFTVTQSISPDDSEYVYAISPDDHKIIDITLSGSADYLPRFIFYDPETDSFIEQIDKLPGDTITYTYTSGLEKREPKTYYLVVETYNSEGESFTLDYKAKSQDDGGSGGDGSHAFREGVEIGYGDYQGHLGDEDTIDYYSLELVAEEDISLVLSPADEASLRLTLIDGNYDTKIDQRAQLAGEEITARYKSLRDQRVWIGVEGSSPYTLSVDGNKPKKAMENQALPPEPETLPGDSPVQIDVTPDPVEPAVSDADKLTPKDQMIKDTGTSKGISTSVVILLVVLVLVLIGVVVFLLMRKPADKPEKAKAEPKKDAPKDEKKN